MKDKTKMILIQAISYCMGKLDKRKKVEGVYWRALESLLEQLQKDA